MATCTKCDFWKPNREDRRIRGQCRRYPPVRSHTNEHGNPAEGAWPITRDVDWCGEFQCTATKP